MGTCSLDPACKNIRTLLTDIGLKPDSIESGCGGVGPCQGIFNNLLLVTQRLNIDNAKSVVELIKDWYGGKLPIDRSTGSIKQIFEQRPFVCPELDLEIRQPCSVRSCSYWTNHAWAKNCILFYRMEQGKESLDLKELAFLLDKNVTELRKKTNVALAEMRRWALWVKTSQISEPSPTVPENYCAVCGQALTDLAVHKQGIHYCGKNCLNKKPPLDFQLEHDFGLAVERVLQICVDSFSARRPMCHALSVTTKQLEDLCSRYSIDPSRIS